MKMNRIARKALEIAAARYAERKAKEGWVECEAEIEAARYSRLWSAIYSRWLK